MTTVNQPYKLYWNNVCLFNRLEEAYITEAIEKHNMKDKLEVHYFGLGREKKLSAQILDHHITGQADADIYITTDLDVYHKETLLHSKLDDFMSLTGSMDIVNQIKSSNIPYKNDHLIPFVIIPQVMVVNHSTIGDLPVPTALKDLAKPCYKGKFVIGGIHNSAGRSIIKVIWHLYGYETAKAFKENAILANMPAMAFNSVLRGGVPISISPSIFAERAGIHDLELICPEEGMIAIPSYIAIKSHVPDEIKSFVIEQLVSIDKQQLFYERGCVLPASNEVDHPFYSHHPLLYPEWSFVNTLDDAAFEALCQ